MARFIDLEDDRVVFCGCDGDYEKYNIPEDMPSADVVEVVRCKDCLYYDPPHVEDAGVRYEYKDMPEEAFDELGTGLVHLEYGINVGGRCCKDYNVGYAEDKRVYRTKNDYCSKGVRRTDGVDS